MSHSNFQSSQFFTGQSTIKCPTAFYITVEKNVTLALGFK